ncbi:MAG: class I SAM-dependent methyltransferase, partial [Bradyrhizobium sp.]
NVRRHADMAATDAAAAPPEEPGAMQEEQGTRPIRSPLGEPQPEANPSAYVLSPPFEADGGAAWMIALPEGLQAVTDTDDRPNRSPLRLLEDGAPLGPGHATHRDIREKGQGLYSFWKTGLWFSTADGSDPNRNGRVYAVAREQPPERVPAPQSVPMFAGGLGSLPAPGPPVDGRGANGTVFSVFGDLKLSQCPVCHSSAITPLWRMPMAALQEPIQVFGGYFNQVPTLQIPSIAYCFDLCTDCESIFLNPVPSKQKEQYRTTEHYVRKMETASEWQGYEDVYDSIAKWIPADATVMMDAACGVGQYLHVARQRSTHAWRRMVGLELAESYVRYMRARGFEAYAFDLDNDDLSPLVEPGSVDFITFSEAFEHVERPLDALRKLVAALRPGGRLYFTAQRYGADVQAAVRPGEPIYIGEKVVAQIPQALGCRIVNMSTSSMRYYIVLEK